MAADERSAAPAQPLPPAGPRRSRSTKRLFIGGERNLRRTLLMRAFAVIGLYLAVVFLFWFDRNGLRDHLDGHISFTDAVYFAAVTVTTVGYGDIVPITPRARTIDALLVTPVRLFIWLIFLGTAYQMVLQRFVEDLRMRALQARLNGHVIVCGFGHYGRCAAAELVARGLDRKQIIVIEPAEAIVELAAEQGYIGLLGNATSEDVLREASVHTARAIFVCTDRDDTNVLVVLTARHLSPGVRVVARVQEAENEKLLRQSGADATVLPSHIGGVLMAGSLDSAELLHYVMDLVTSGGRVMLIERDAQPQDIGKRPAELTNAVLVRLTRAGREIDLATPEARIGAGDHLVMIVPGTQ